METRANHALIGAFTLGVLTLAMLFALWIGKATLEREWSWYLVVFNEAVSGLTVGSPVQYNGIQIGEVRKLALDPQDPSRVFATIRVAASTPVKTDTVAMLAYTGLTGVSLIQLSGGSRNAPMLEPDPEIGVAVINAETSALQKLLASSEDIATTASQVMLRINTLLGPENMGKIASMLENFEATSATVAESRENIRTTLAEAAQAGAALNRTLAGAEQAIGRIDGAIARLDRDVLRRLPDTIAALQETVESLERFAVNADALLADNRESLSSFSQQGLSQVGPALDEMRSLLRDLRRMSQQIEQSPARFLIGGEPLPEFEP
jgi:phospholipid/cholesterol/gamma-HCH transport system substrate-binding protein